MGEIFAEIREKKPIEVVNDVEVVNKDDDSSTQTQTTLF